MLRIWGRTNSINVQKVMWAVGELGLAHERIDAGGAFGGLDTDAYRALNANGRVPTIEDDGLVAWESNACVRYLAARYDAGGLWPEDPAKRAGADMWMDWQQTTLMTDMTTVFWGLVRTPEAERDHAAIEAAAGRLGGLWRRLDKHLAARPFVAGERFSMGDIPVGAACYRYLQLPIERPQLAAIEAWYGRLQEREPYRDPRHAAAHLSRSIARRPRMRYRPFGRTGLEVSELVFGGGFVGGILIHADDDTKLAALRCGLDGGMNWIDTAPSYGDGRSEEALGWLLKEVDAEALPVDQGPARSRARRSAGQIEASLEQSLKRLRRDKVDLFQLHNPIGAEASGDTIGVGQVLGAKGVAETFERLREQGLFDLTGITALGDRGADLRGDRERPLRFRAGLPQPARSERRPGGAAGLGRAGLYGRARRLSRARRRDDEHPRPGGRRDRDRPAPRPRDADRPGLRHGRRGSAGARRVREARRALRHARADRDPLQPRQSRISSCVIVGFAEIGHIEEALAGAEMGPLPEEALAALREVYAEPPR